MPGKALKNIKAVVDLIGLHTIKKADPKDPLKVQVLSACMHDVLSSMCEGS